MNDETTTAGGTAPAIPPDDTRRDLVIANPDENSALPHYGVVGDTYTILVGGHDTAGRYALIDMHVLPGGGPPPHRHDFEEMFHVLEGEIEITFRGATSVARRGSTVNVPANAPHSFRNASDSPTRLLCMASPSGLDAYFAAFGVPVSTRTAAPPTLDEADQQALMANAIALAPNYRIENLPE